MLQPVHAIGGRVIDESKKAIVGTRVWAVPAGSLSPHTTTSLDREAYADTSPKGEFLITGLPDGLYDLYAGQRFAAGGNYGFSTGLVRLNDVPAGMRGAEIVVPSSGGVRVRLVLGDLGTGQAPDHMTVLVGTFVPSDGRLPPTDSPELIEGGALGSWPLDAPWRFGGAAGSQVREGRYWYGLYGAKEIGDHDVRDLGEGWYLFGVQLAAGEAYAPTHFPVATDLVYLRPGEHEVHFALTPTAPLSGRLVSSEPVAHLSVALLDDEGRAIPMERPAENYLDRFSCLPVNAAGEFYCPVAPIGQHRLRVGTTAEFAAGHGQAETSIEIKGGPGERFEIRL